MKISVSLFTVISFLIFLGCVEKETSAKVKEAEPNGLSLENSIYLRHLDLMRMKYLLDLENEHLEYFLTQDDFQNNRLYKEWFNYYETDKTVELLNELKRTRQESNRLIKDGLVKLDSFKLSDRLNKTILNTISNRIETLKLLRDSLDVRIEKDFNY